MPFLNKVSGGSARKFGFSRRSTFFTCNTHTAMVTLNNADRKCYYPANYTASSSQGPLSGWSCPSGGSNCGDYCTGNYCTRTDVHAMAGVGNDGSCGGINMGNGNFLARPDYSYPASPVYSTNYSCPTNTAAVTRVNTSCNYPAAYNATENG